MHIDILPGTYGVDSLCQKCAEATTIDDSNSEFYYEGVHKDEDGKPTLRHKNEGKRSLMLPSSVIQWTDVVPDYPDMEASARAGCRLCGLIREALLRRDIHLANERRRVRILCGYVWGGDRAYYDPHNALDDGLVYMRCEVFGDGESQADDERLAWIVFPAETADDDLASWLRVGKRRTTKPLDPKNIEWLKEELEFCDNECTHQAPDPLEFIPTRLIDVGTPGETDPCLIESSELDISSDTPLKYAALSYCWGPRADAEKQLKTVWMTYESHCKGMPLSTMTPVLRDAVTVCQALSIRYIWIDALCIVQDDLEDWSKESEVMGLVYYYAYLTICPLASRSCVQGFLGPRPPGVNVGFRSSLRPTTQGTITFYESHSDKDMTESGRPKDKKFDLDDPLYLDMSLSAWETRGWTFQEEHSSFRLLYFGRNMMHLACPAWNSSENGLLLSTGSVHHGPFHQLLDLAVASKRDSDQEPEEAADDVPLWETPAFTVRQIWEQMSLITKREFTYRQDIFPALASLAKAAAKVQNDTYLAGLWEKTLHSGLLWFICQPKPGSLDETIAKLRRDDNNDPYIAPSWSWVGSEEYFEYLARPTYTVEDSEPDRSSESADSKPYYYVGTRPSHLVSEITLLEPRIKHESASRYGRLQPGASLLIRGRLLRQFPGGGGMIQKPEGDGRAATAYFTDSFGSICLDWSVLEETRQRAPEGMVLLLTASCCQATSNEVLRWHANPDEEEHTLGLSDRVVHPDRADDDDGLSPSEGDSKRSSRREEAETCLSCLDEEGRQSKNAFGLVLYPDDTCQESGRSRYFRVGIFVLFGHSGGLRLFEDASFCDVEIV